MDSTNLHLALTHFPIIGTIIGTLVLAYGIYSKNNPVVQTAMMIFIGIALLAIPAFLTGEGAGEVIKKLPDVSESMKETHEELAEKAIWIVELLGLCSLAGLIILKKAPLRFKMATITVLVVSIVTIGIMSAVGNTGGKIRHSEIRPAETIPVR